MSVSCCRRRVRPKVEEPAPPERVSGTRPFERKATELPWSAANPSWSLGRPARSGGVRVMRCGFRRFARSRRMPRKRSRTCTPAPTERDRYRRTAVLDERLPRRRSLTHGSKQILARRDFVLRRMRRRHDQRQRFHGQAPHTGNVRIQWSVLHRERSVLLCALRSQHARLRVVGRQVRGRGR